MGCSRGVVGEEALPTIARGTASAVNSDEKSGYVSPKRDDSVVSERKGAVAGLSSLFCDGQMYFLGWLSSTTN